MEMFYQKSWELRLFRCWKLADPNCYFFFITVPVACKTTTKFILFKASATSEGNCAKKFLSLDDNSPIFLQHCRLFHHPPEDFKEKKKKKLILPTAAFSSNFSEYPFVYCPCPWWLFIPGAVHEINEWKSVPHRENSGTWTCHHTTVPRNRDYRWVPPMSSLREGSDEEALVNLLSLVTLECFDYDYCYLVLWYNGRQGGEDGSCAFMLKPEYLWDFYFTVTRLCTISGECNCSAKFVPTHCP